MSAKANGLQGGHYQPVSSGCIKQIRFDELNNGTMGLRILLIGDDLNYMMKDGAMLRAHGLRVYFCNDFRLVGDLMDETKPDVLFVNAKVHDEESTAMYHRLLDNVHYASIPVIYTLSANDVYLVNRKRTATRESRYMTSNNIIDAIKMAFVTSDNPAPGKRIPLLFPTCSGGYSPYRA